MIWVISFAVLWVGVGFLAALVIGRGLRAAEQREFVRRQTTGLRGEGTPEQLIVQLRRIAG